MKILLYILCCFAVHLVTSPQTRFDGSQVIRDQKKFNITVNEVSCDYTYGSDSRPKMFEKHWRAVRYKKSTISNWYQEEYSVDSRNISMETIDFLFNNK